VDAAVILAVVVANALIGFFQEYKAERALESLKAYLSTKALAMRDGRVVTISTEDIVPGDLLVLKAGMKIPADARLIEAQGLLVNVLNSGRLVME